MAMTPTELDQGARWETIATASGNQTYAQKLTTLYNVWKDLSATEKTMTRVLRGSTVCNQSEAGVYYYTTYDGGSLLTRILNLNAKVAFISQGNTYGAVTSITTEFESTTLYLEILR